MSSAIFSARVWFYDTNLFCVETWSDEFIPMTLDEWSSAEWGKLHIENCYSGEDLRELLGVPPTGDLQVMFTAKVSSVSSGYEVIEWDEEMEIVGEVKHTPIPPDYADCVFYSETPQEDSTNGT